MCGITGILFSDITKNVDPDLLDRMCLAIKHRGPNETGTWIKGPIGIGMTRLSIIDIAGGRQPIHNEDKSIWIVFNGEIYNYIELQDNLIKKGHVFYTSSDTETIVHLYEEYGEDCVSFLSGMFAFSIWDDKKKTLFIARDRIGIKPMHYYFDNQCFIFGSEIKSILESNGVNREMYPPALVNYFFYGYVPDPETMFKGIYKLPPGHLMTYKNGKLTIRQYWDVQFKVEKIQPEEFYIERLFEILTTSVKGHMISEVPLGAFLSGGIDSSMVVALMAIHSSRPVKTFSIGFSNQKYNELKYARMVANRYGTEHYEEIVMPDAESIIMDLVQQFDEPFADSSAIPTYYVSRMAKKWVTVVLSGDGGDELFAGYTHYLKSPITRYTGWLPRHIRKGIFMNLTKMMPEWSPGFNTLRHIACDKNERLINKYSKNLSTFHKEIFSQQLSEKVDSTDPSPALCKYLDRVKDRDELTRLQYLDTKTYLPGDILTKVDRTSMLVSLEARVPILDHHLVEFAATIPPELKLKGITTKYLFKKAAERLIPKEVIYRPKQGFAVPIDSWIKKEWSDMSNDLVLGNRAMARQNFNPKFLKRIMTEHFWGRRNHSHIIWTLMMLELWYREKLEKDL